ncbi:unnamed protein product [Brassica oleracea var. botrytis]|uniref:AT-hook motif nuclear-localized protein n=3 Tax=Brassica oleracea TaxID=3712 RepID=A0A0D3B592_BRAOL|nr:unnamed protein product [Brassica oleracea]
MDLNESSNSVSMSDSSSNSSSDSSCDSPSPVRVRATVGEETKGDDTLVQRSCLYDPKGKSIIPSGTQERSSAMRSLSMGADPTRRLGGGDFKAHMLMINAREDIIEKIMSFTQNGSRGICVLSATGAVFNLRIQSLGSNRRVLTFKDCYEIISLTNTVEITESGGVRNETGVWRITIGGVDGCVFGGNLVGRLTAASQVQVVIGSFWPLIANPSLRKKDTSTSVLVTPTVPNAVGSSSGGQVHQPEMRDSSHFSSSEWYRKYSGYNP